MDPGADEQPDQAELASRVDQLEQTVSKMLPDRRGVIKGLGAAAVGGAAVGASSGGASGQSAAGQVGTESEPVDVEAASVAAQSVSTEQLNDVYCASNFDGSDGGEQIQNAVDEASLSSYRSAVVVGPKGPDGVNNDWVVSSTITLPTRTSLILNSCYLFLADNTNDNVIRNESAPTTTGDDPSSIDEDVSIVGIGEPIIDGNGPNQTTFDRETEDSWKNIGVRFHGVQKGRVENITIKSTNGWGYIGENVQDLKVSEIRFLQDDITPNQDGVHIVGPAEDVQISEISGETGDDMVGVNDKDPDNFNCGSGGNVSAVTINTVTGEALGNQAGVRIYASGDFDVRNVTASDVNFHSGGAAARVGFTEQSPPFDTFENITLSNISAGSEVDSAVVQETTVKGLTIENVSHESDTGPVIHFQEQISIVTIDGVTVVGNPNNVILADSQDTFDGVDISGVNVEGGGATQGATAFNLDASGNSNTIHDCVIRDVETVFDVSNNIDGFITNITTGTVGTDFVNQGGLTKGENVT